MLTRRFFLQSTGAMAAYVGVGPILNAVAAPATQPVAARKTLVVVFLRGGIDGLNFVIPYADPDYNALRPSLKIGRPGETDGALDLDGFFGLHARCSALMPLFDSGQAVAAHAVGYAQNTRSHFEEQDRWETGVIGNTLGADGWLNRHLATSQGHGPVRAVSIGNTLPRILRGDAPAYAIRGLTDLGLPNDAHADKVAAALEHAYQCDPQTHDAQRSAARELVLQTGSETLEGMKLIKKVAAEPYTPAATYPEKNPLSGPLQSTARLIKADLGLEVVELDYGGWDSHNNQGDGIYGGFGDRVGRLGDALAAFAQDLGPRLEDTLILTLSDFGRTARQNGSRGTDHGWGNAMLAIGGGVGNTGEKTGVQQRRKVIGNWPGLSKDKLYQGRDLQHTTDFRDVLAEAVHLHLGNDQLKTVLPNHTFQSVGLVA